ncbi:MAG: 2,3-diaminopropionate biosynthesis protein SbnB [Burkholderiaceae bacterium]
MDRYTPTLKVVGARQIEQWLERHPQDTFDLVRDTYRSHGSGKTVNPDSYFLRFPGNDRSRIIALPASLEDDDPVAGIKWISSFPQNLERGIDRASALLILNDRETGYPTACLEGSAISAARTAASAIVAAHYLHPERRSIRQLGIVGCGPIALATLSLLVRLGWEIGLLLVADLCAERARLFREKCGALGVASAAADCAETVRTSDMVLFATSAGAPHVDDAGWFAHCPTVLHLSLRDLAPAVILSAQNFADDIGHCMKAATSVDLTSREVGHRRFMAGDITDLIDARVKPDLSRARIFSPFGMGVLDLALARAITRSLRKEDAVVIDDFFPSPYIDRRDPVAPAEKGMGRRL